MRSRRGWITGLVGLVPLLSIGVTCAQTRVEGYFRKDGTYVQPHVRTAPDSNPYNNYDGPTLAPRAPCFRGGARADL
jgi:hypothetical protein